MTSQSSGVGRGRGWLNLSRSCSSRPGPPSPDYSESISVFELSFPSPAPIPSYCAHQYAKLISTINHLSTNDDGILLNQKLKNIVEVWSQECMSREDVEECISYIYQKSLEDEVFSTKSVLMVSSFSFKSLKICQEKVRSLFIGKMQDTFENAKELQLTKPPIFRNAVRILSEFYSRTRLSDGRPIRFLGTPLLCYFNMLLTSAHPADLELFTTLLYLNGSSIKTDFAHKLSELLNRVRDLLICDIDLTQTCKLYLLLAIDISNNRFSLLPSDVNKFYQDHLGDKIMAQFQGSLIALSIQTQQSSKALDSYQSNVNVLQVTPPDSTSPVSEQQPIVQATSKPDKYSSGAQGFNGSFATAGGGGGGATAAAAATETTGINLSGWENGSKDTTSVSSNHEKTGRPILGAGARLQKSKKEDSNWRDHSKENSTSGWTGKQKSSSWNGDKKSLSKSLNKGWEHDDRFDNDYN